MAGIRRFRGGCFPGTLSQVAAVADGLVNGQFLKLDASDGQLLAATGIADSTATAPEFISASEWVSGVTGPSTATTYKMAVVPVDDQMTFIGECYNSALTINNFTPKPGSTARFNLVNWPTSGFAAGTVLVTDTAADHNTDAMILETLQAGDSAIPAIVEFKLINLTV